jgi:uncharacterized protein (DUF302 family)
MNLKTLIILVAFCVTCVNAFAQDSGTNGIVTVESTHDFATTGTRLEQAISEAGLTLVMTLDHAANAARADLELLPTQLFIFGNPQVGTPLMQQARSHALDLPQKMLIWEADDGTVFVSYNDPTYLASRHGLDPSERTNNITNALANLATLATGDAAMER